MSSPSNIYAEKIYAEHPTALWAFDDTCDFVSYLTTPQLAIGGTGSGWTLSGYDGTPNPSFNNSQDPFPPLTNSPTLYVSGNGTSPVTLTGPTFSSSNPYFSVGFWFNSQSTGIQSVSISCGTGTEQTTSIAGRYDEWIYISSVFSGTVTSQPLVIKINYSTIIGGDAYDFYINGLSIGYQQENFGTESTGVQLSALPSTISQTGLYGLASPAYGSVENTAYYIGNNTTKTMYAKNSSIPMVYGATSNTILYPKTGPSLIVPGLGFMNDIGRYQTLTLETWLRANVDGTLTGTPKRIIGPINSSDGLYVDGPYLTLKVGTAFDSHYVGEWFRPMLINIEMAQDLASLIVNGERVISLDINSATISLPSKYDGNGKDQDYIGFYAYSDIPFIEIDCVAIYPYRVPTVVAKRRYVYGQAVTPPENLATAYSGTQLFMDYTFAGYSSDYKYPKPGAWKSTTKDNVYVTESVMGSPRYTIPDITLTKTFTEHISDTSEWINDVKLMNENVDTKKTNPYFRIRPVNGNHDWSNVMGYIHIDKLRVRGMEVPSIVYGVFEAIESPTDYQVLVRLKNKTNHNQISIVLEDGNLVYRYRIDGKSGIIGTPRSVGTSAFAAGINIPQLIKYAQTTLTRSGIDTFLNNLQNLELFLGGDYIGGDPELTTTFTGNIYCFGIASEVNAASIASYFDSTAGLIKTTTTAATALSFKPSYLISVKKFTFGTDVEYAIDLSTKSYWEDYLPLSTLSKVSKNTAGVETYRTDMIQFSIDYPASYLTKVSGGSTVIDTSNSMVKTYVAFRYSEASLPKYGQSMSITELPSTGIVNASSNWANKKYEVVDGTVIVPPKTGFASGRSQQDITMVTFIEINTDSISKNKVEIRTLEYAAQTFNSYTSDSFEKALAKPIGTRLGQPVYPFSDATGKFIYDAYNPIAIGKTSSPYLYLSNKTGIKVLGSYGLGEDRGIYLPINPNGYDDFNVASLDMFLNYNDKEFSSTAMTMFETYDSQYGHLRFKIQRVSSTDPTSAKILVEKIVGNTTAPVSGINFYINGKYTPNPVIKLNEWFILGILFVGGPLAFSNYTNGRIEIVGSALISHLSYYQIDAAQLAQQVSTNEWNDIKGSSPAKVGGTYLANTWGAVLENTTVRGTWNLVAISQTSVSPDLTPEQIFSIYTGTNKIISTAFADTSGIKLKSYAYSVYVDSTWQTPSTLSV